MMDNKHNKLQYIVSQRMLESCGKTKPTNITISKERNKIIEKEIDYRYKIPSLTILNYSKGFFGSKR